MQQCIVDLSMSELYGFADDVLKCAYIHNMVGALSGAIRSLKKSVIFLMTLLCNNLNLGSLLEMYL